MHSKRSQMQPTTIKLTTTISVYHKIRNEKMKYNLKGNYSVGILRRLID